MESNSRVGYESYFLKGMLLFVASAMLSACGGGDFSDLEQKIAEIKARPKGRIDPLPPMKTTEPFSFELGGTRDPFEKIEQEAASEEGDSAASSVRPDPTRVKEDLERFALDTLRMVGTMKKDDTLWALVQVGNGTVYRVKTGNYMGQHDGKITEISGDEIKLMEIVSDKDPNKYREQPAALKLVATE
jgi:type IV pilus assembly protein PilP